MGFIKPVIIYERIYDKKKKVRVYINQCHNKGKTKLFTIRRDDSQGFAHLLGVIKWDGAWRQYVTEFEPDTKWCSSCKRAIADFEDKLNKDFRKKQNKKIKILKELRKGCGKAEYYGNKKISETNVCGMGWYCKSCQELLRRRK